MILFLFYLKGRETETDLPSTSSFLKCPEKLGLAQADVRNLELSPCLLDEY